MKKLLVLVTLALPVVVVAQTEHLHLERSDAAGARGSGVAGGNHPDWNAATGHRGADVGPDLEAARR